ncbi:MAG TPA: hypothetical protein VMG10_18550 [Gemmataceae bacterium]|nr:hypothetical protein [Gemmataceae bacterium]
MFTLDDLRNLLSARPFVPFRMHLSEGAAVDVRSQEVVLPGRRFAVIGLLDPDATDTAFDRWAVVWYMHVTRVEMLGAGSPPFSAPSGPAESPTPSPA